MPPDGHAASGLLPTNRSGVVCLAQFSHQVSCLGEDQALQGQLYGGGRSRRAKDKLVSHGAGDGPGDHGGGADLCERQQAEQFTEAGQGALQQRADGFIGTVTPGDAGAAVEKNQIDVISCDDPCQPGAHLIGFIGKNVPHRHLVAGGVQARSQQISRAVGARGAAV